MGENKTFRIISAILFIAFAGVSCWATVESLFLSLPDIPKFVFWVAVIGVFLLTSYLTKIAVNCFNPNVYMEKRSMKLLGSFLGILLLWVCFSMPTNTHTFFYKKMSKDVAKKELNFLNVELSKLTDENLYIKNYYLAWEDKFNKVKSLQNIFEKEIDDFEKLGYGKEAEEKLQKIEDELGLKRGSFERKHPKGTDQRERTAIKKFYDNLIKDQLEILKKSHVMRLDSQLVGFRKESKKIKNIKDNISKTLNELDNPSLKQSEVINKATQLSQTAHATLDSKYGYLIASDTYKTTNIYSLDRLRSITKVWGDYLKGEFKDKNYGLIYWILLSIIVDLAAFLFFNIAFKQED